MFKEMIVLFERNFTRYFIKISSFCFFTKGVLCAIIKSGLEILKVFNIMKGVLQT